MLARIVASPDRVVANFIGWPAARPPGPAMGLADLAHRVSYDRAKLERRAAGRVFLMMMVTLDDLNIGLPADPGQQCRGAAHQIHRDVDREAHAGRLKHGDRLGSFPDLIVVRGGESRGGHDERHPLGHAGRDDPGHCLGK